MWTGPVAGPTSIFAFIDFRSAGPELARELLLCVAGLILVPICFARRSVSFAALPRINALLEFLVGLMPTIFGRDRFRVVSPALVLEPFCRSFREALVLAFTRCRVNHHPLQQLASRRLSIPDDPTIYFLRLA